MTRLRWELAPLRMETQFLSAFTRTPFHRSLTLSLGAQEACKISWGRTLRMIEVLGSNAWNVIKFLIRDALERGILREEQPHTELIIFIFQAQPVYPL